jgi:hypothetical protein
VRVCGTDHDNNRVNLSLYKGDSYQMTALEGKAEIFTVFTVTFCIVNNFTVRFPWFCYQNVAMPESCPNCPQPTRF